MTHDAVGRVDRTPRLLARTISVAFGWGTLLYGDKDIVYAGPCDTVIESSSSALANACLNSGPLSVCDEVKKQAWVCGSVRLHTVLVALLDSMLCA
jgi:hypothetical protein